MLQVDIEDLIDILIFIKTWNPINIIAICYQYVALLLITLQVLLRTIWNLLTRFTIFRDAI